MNPKNKWLKITGLVLNVAIAALIIFAGSTKVLGFVPAENLAEMKKLGLEDKLLLIGYGELITGVILIIPWTAPLGVLLTSGFWGGVICFNMTHDQPYIPWCVMLLLTWVGGFLRGSVPLLAIKSGPPPG